MESLKVKSVQRTAWNNEEVKLSNDAMDVTINIKDPEFHGSIKLGEYIDDLFADGGDNHQEVKSLIDEQRKEIEDLKAQLSAALAPK